MNLDQQNNVAEPYLLSVKDNQKINLKQPKFTIGRGLHNSYVVEDLQISRTHCLFETINGVWCLTDQSSNGTLVNNKKIPPKTPQMLSNGDKIKLTDRLEYVFVNNRKDSMDDIDLLEVVDEAEIRWDEWSLEVIVPSERETRNIEDVPLENNENRINVCCETKNETESATNTDNLGHQHVNIADIPDVTSNMDIPNVDTQDTSAHAAINPGTSTVAIPTSFLEHSYISSKDNTINQIEKPQQENNALEMVEDELQCIICTELFIKTTTLNCSHSFCKYCLEEWKKKNKKCPICRTKITSVTPTIVLDNLIAKVLESASDEVKQKREEVIKSREPSQQTVPPIVIKGGRITRQRNTPIEISSGEDTDYDDDDDDYTYEDDDYNGIPGAYYGGYGHCYTCGERGHWANGCPYR